ncbi:hypothetical protein E1A91_D04G072400v1 [Gossypium mustelinum]|uniref:DUF4283 domain-containing protein n=1 Tax=Gossypium mustelinum TaxID=34275 RepID=A0A5D2VB07_GOSMU|nr:hypothetical protein E1A91_D04G072400v1 [Gossypium mustelinum]
MVKLLRRSIDYATLVNRVESLWRPSKSFRIMDVENGHFLVKLQNKEDYGVVLTQ